jgi:hypothetical protein
MRKSQAYGISIFIYSIAIAILLIIGMIGISKQIDLYSADVLYKQIAVGAVDAVEGIKNLLSSERAYMVEKALYLSADFSGYPYLKLTLEGNGEDKVTRCGVSNVGVDFIPEKVVPYFKDDKCIPGWDSIVNSIKSNLRSFSNLQPSIAQALLVSQGIDLSNAGYVFSMDTSDLDDKGVIHTKWVLNTGKLHFVFPNRYTDIVEYSMPTLIELDTKTNIKKLYDSMKSFVSNRELDNYLNTPGESPIPIIIDKDGRINNPPREEPFRDLVNFTLTNYPSSPNPCNGFSLSQLSSLSDEYSKTCGVETYVNSSTGLLIVKKYTGDCASSTDLNDTAMKCVLNATINNINKKFSSVIRKDVASLNVLYPISGGRTVRLYHNGDYFSSNIINQVIDGKGFYKEDYCAVETPYSQCYGFVKLESGDNIRINLNNFEIDTIVLTFKGDEKDISISYESGGYIYNVTKEMPVNITNLQDGSKQLTVTIPSSEVHFLYIYASGEVKLAEVDAYTTNDNYRVLFKSFNLTFNGMDTLKKEKYIAIDIDNGTVAPHDYAEPNPQDCSITLKDEVKKYAVTTEGGSCADSNHVCCNGLQCCDSGQYAGQCRTTCECKHIGDACSSSDECCANEKCIDNHCCGSYNARCSSDNDCCSGYSCSNQHADFYRCCIKDGDTTADGTGCCSGNAKKVGKLYECVPEGVE